MKKKKLRRDVPLADRAAWDRQSVEEKWSKSEKAAGGAAEEAFALASKYLKGSLSGSPSLLSRAWRELGDMFDAVTQTNRKKPIAQAVPMMSDKEANQFRKSLMPFGKHAGEKIEDVPLSYLAWIDEDRFRNDLHRYLNREDEH